MYMGKRVKRGASRKKPALLVASLALLLSVSVAGTLAFLVAKSGTVTNTFELTSPTIEVEEDFDGEVKSNVMIKNTGTADAYVRAAVVATWVKKNGDAYDVYGTAPVFGKDYIWYDSNADGADDEYNKANWTFREADGFYYYEGRVEAGKATEILFTKCSVMENADIPEGYTLSVEIIAQSIQADGMGKNDAGEEKTPVELAWGYEAAVLVGAVSAGSAGEEG